MNRANRSLWCLLVAQSQVAFADNASKMLLITMVVLVMGEQDAGWVRSLIAALLVLPFVIFAPLAGWVSDRFAKSKVLLLALVAQVILFCALSLAVWWQNLALAITAFFGLAVQSSFFSPAKQGILKELVGVRRLGFAVGWMEMLTICAILLGSLYGAWAFESLAEGGKLWQAAFWVCLSLLATSCGALVFMMGVRRTRSRCSDPFRLSLWCEHFQQLRHLWARSSLRLSAFGMAYFWGLGGFLFLAITQLGTDWMGAELGAGTLAATLLFAMGSGIAVSSVIAATLSRRNQIMGLIPVGALGMVGCLWVASTLTEAGWWATLTFFGSGFSGGLFVVPLNTYFQATCPDSERGRMLAANNLLINVSGLAAVGIYFLAQMSGLSATQQFFAAGGVTLLVSWWILWLLP